jgi:hypothetical protein
VEYKGRIGDKLVSKRDNLGHNLMCSIGDALSERFKLSFPSARNLRGWLVKQATSYFVTDNVL